jgi:hypothetical protein
VRVGAQRLALPLLQPPPHAPGERDQATQVGEQLLARIRRLPLPLFVHA